MKKKRLLEPLKLEQIEPRLRKAILDAVRGNPESPWPIDKHYPRAGTFEQRFKGGRDNQIMLWAIALAAEDNEPIPEWATTALMEKLLEVAVAAKDWDGAFGATRAMWDGEAEGAKASKIIHRSHYMFKCYDIVKERHAGGEGESLIGALFEDIGRKLGFSGSIVSDYYYAVKNWIMR
jgi:hypothetical protein